MQKNKLNLEKIKRGKSFLIKLSVDEYDAVNAAAIRKGLTKAGYFRQYLLPIVEKDAGMNEQV